MVPGSQFAWHDESFTSENAPVAASSSAPLFMVASAFDQGIEDPVEIESSDFNRMFGTMSYDKYGQISLQAQNTINAGGRLFVKRLVADDATLANLVIVAKLSSEQKEQQKYDDDGNPLYYTDETKTQETTEETEYPVMLPVYYDEDGNETTENTGNPVMIAVVKWEAQSVEGATTDYDIASDAVDSLVETLNGTEFTYPIFCIKDNGRGTSTKSFRVSPDYNVSRGIGHMFYRGIIYTNGANTDEKMFTVDPDVIYSNTAYRLENDTFTQINSSINEVAFERFVNDLADITLIDASTLRNYDLINGVTNKGTVISSITIADDSIDLNASNGIALQNGSNGSFTENGPMSTEEAQEKLYAKMISYYNGDMTDEIYDVDQHMVSCILDANFPNEVKDAIGNLVAFRKDCVFLRDINTGHYTYGDIYSALSALPDIPIDDNTGSIINDASSYDNSKFFADYITSYKIRDPYTYKVIEVTMMYDMATILVDHFMSTPNAPLAGQYNNFILSSAIKGTINFTPLNTPKINQKQAIEDLRANYAMFEGNLCVVQSLYTCQEKQSQLSYLNNVIAIEHIMRVVRQACPRNRYSLADGRDLSNYATAVERVLEDYKTMFNTLEFEYTQNDIQSDQKIFAASIKFAFNNWAQSEYFDLYAINSNSLTTTESE